MEKIFNEIARDKIIKTVNGFNGKVSKVEVDLFKKVFEKFLSAAVIAHGQASIGKTITVFGNDFKMGLFSFCIDCMFQEIGKQTDRFFIVRIAVMENFKDGLIDLANDEQIRSLKVREATNGFIFVENLIEEICSDPEQAKDLVYRSVLKRRNGHLFCRIVVESKLLSDAIGKESARVSQFDLAVLAGSESSVRIIPMKMRQVAKMASINERNINSKLGQFQRNEALKESAAINKSLLSLDMVIQQLQTSTGSPKCTNFRNSILTRLLQNNLNGDCYTAFLCLVSSEPSDFRQSLKTLQVNYFFKKNSFFFK